MSAAAQELRDKARARFMAGLESEAVAAELGLKPQRVAAWAAAGGWEARRRAWWSDPRGAAAALRQLLGRRVEELMALGELSPQDADHLAKIAAACSRLEREGYDLKAAAVEVGERLAALAGAEPGQEDQRAWLGRLLEKLFARLENEAGA
ncbi:MAG: hypothetical protein KJ720_07520 [Proteobacteria bacterium]|nr:hypothetical protein [Pseudomonadota bacterium]MBU1452288.1 hypothetical protein [Pseudomonadota bacterium]MBU2470000.1 hypothetical protein [Pseudomonadota bacterium]MBU2519461.1 hypothetical protein [Pseudomonadota bacterium]